MVPPTPNQSPDTDLGHEVAPADGRIESATSVRREDIILGLAGRPGLWEGYTLLTLIIRLTRVFQPAGICNCDYLALDRLRPGPRDTDCSYHAHRTWYFRGGDREGRLCE